MARPAKNPGRNPFQPGRGVLPPLIADRDEELALAEERLADLADGDSPSEDLLFYGPRGNGKTTLLREVERRARSRGFRVVDLPVHALTAKGELVAELQRRTSEPVGVPTRNIAEMFADWVAADSARPLVITLDEIQNSNPEVARPFFDAVQKAKYRAAPLVLLAAGTPDAPRCIWQAGNYERGFHEVPVGRLSRAGTIAALSEPAQAAGRPIVEDAAALLAEESQDYPYFIQLLGSAAWDAAARNSSAAEISRPAAQQAATECRGVIEDFFTERYREAESYRLDTALKPLARLFTDNGGRLDHPQLEALLRRLAKDDGTPFDHLGLEAQLSDIGVLWEVEPRVWEMGIPSFADYLLRHP